MVIEERRVEGEGSGIKVGDTMPFGDVKERGGIGEEVAVKVDGHAVGELMIDVRVGVRV